MHKKVSDFLYRNESYLIIGACFKVYNNLGGGIKEKIIERALSTELLERGLKIQNQAQIDILYNNQKVGIYIPDIIVNNKIIIEIKSKPFLTLEDKKQFWGYLRNSRYKLGFLVGFTPQKLTIKRFIYTKNVFS